MARTVQDIFSILRKRQHRLAILRPAILRAVGFGILILIVQRTEFSFLATSVFLLGSFLLYIRPIQRSRSVFISGTAVTFLALFITDRFAISPTTSVALTGQIPFPQIAFAGLFGLLFYLVVGIKQSVFIHQKEAYYFLHLSIFYLSFILYFGASFTSTSILLKSIILFIFAVLMERELFQLFGHPPDRKLTVISWVVALLILEAVWAVSFLPLAFAPAASIATLFTFMLSEIASRYSEGGLTARFVRVSGVAFLILLSAILFFARWIP